jgi:hypothetical protein
MNFRHIRKSQKCRECVCCRRQQQCLLFTPDNGGPSHLHCFAVFDKRCLFCTSVFLQQFVIYHQFLRCFFYLFTTVVLIVLYQCVFVVVVLVINWFQDVTFYMLSAEYSLYLVLCYVSVYTVYVHGPHSIVFYKYTHKVSNEMQH